MGRQSVASLNSFTVERPKTDAITHSSVTETAVATEKRP